jgi:Amidase
MHVAARLLTNPLLDSPCAVQPRPTSVHGAKILSFNTSPPELLPFVLFVPVKLPISLLETLEMVLRMASICSRSVKRLTDLRQSEHDLPQATACQLQALLQNRLLSGTMLIQICLQQIHTLNKKFNVMISIANEESLRARARQLDMERSHGKTRGPLHGIPVIVKVRSVQSIPPS